MTKVLMLVLVCAFAIGMVACGDDDDDGAADNVGACESLEETLNGLECVAEGWDWGLSCESYADYACDIADYFNCLEDATVCTDDDPSVLDISGWADCADLASCD